ncbi:hypothetical protein [Hymenobacter actinosclerus]|uniref:hypothetical protein n=1 Tax=Hymenobacter actinosclerus TaxID=82805 RepID=UPI001C435192|nr:hypothetical protein [Hymenobacter actinosclerus]
MKKVFPQKINGGDSDSRQQHYCKPIATGHFGYFFFEMFGKIFQRVGQQGAAQGYEQGR